jgi:Stress responsive A/B Barrel Domain
MMLHVVLFRPRPDLAQDTRQRLAEAFALAIDGISSIKRARIGQRRTHGRPYEQLMREDYTHAAILEFDDLEGLKAYLDHPAHAELGSRFFECFEQALMYDFDVRDGHAGLNALVEEQRA